MSVWLSNAQTILTKGKYSIGVNVDLSKKKRCSELATLYGNGTPGMDTLFTETATVVANYGRCRLKQRKELATLYGNGTH